MTAWFSEQKALLNLNVNRMEVSVSYWLSPLRTKTSNIAAALPENDPRRTSLLAAARVHAQAGIANVSGEHYEGSHWLASFATYLVTRRGIL